jgi:nitric oxide reductase subunit C
MKKTRDTRFNIGFMALLLSVFGLYNFTIYTKENSKHTNVLSQKALEGETLWQQNSCFSCHQLYGLGGYLGPDLTNVFSVKGKGSGYIEAYLNSGIKTMPHFNFSENEKKAIVTFLKEVDQSGYYPNHNATIKPNGWVDIQYKNEK